MNLKRISRNIALCLGATTALTSIIFLPFYIATGSYKNRSNDSPEQIFLNNKKETSSQEYYHEHNYDISRRNYEEYRNLRPEGSVEYTSNATSMLQSNDTIMGRLVEAGVFIDPNNGNTYNYGTLRNDTFNTDILFEGEKNLHLDKMKIVAGEEPLVRLVVDINDPEEGLLVSKIIKVKDSASIKKYNESTNWANKVDSASANLENTNYKSR